MYCKNCGAELPDNAQFCSVCGNKVGQNKHKNIYIALILSFFLSGIGSVYAGNVKKGLILFAARILLVFIGVFLNIFLVFSMILWAFSFYEAYRDVQIANGHNNPRLIADFKGWNRNRQIVCVIVIAVVLFFTVFNCISILSVPSYDSDYSDTQYYADTGSSYQSSSSHYGGVDDSPATIAKNDPDWYYDHYEYGDNPEIDDYLESEGYD